MPRPLLAALVVFVAGCSAAAAPGAPGGDLEPAGSTSEAVTTSGAVARAELWVQAKLRYCQSTNGAPDGDPACAPVCQRTSDPAWDPYRSDCSGLVSWAWGLPPPGRVTGEFAPFVMDLTHTIAASDLHAGDAANRKSGGHIVLFKQWTVPGKEAVFIEEPGCSSSMPYAHEFTSAVTLGGADLDIAYEGETFTAIRYDAIVPDPPMPEGGPADASDGGASPPVHAPRDTGAPDAAETVPAEAPADGASSAGCSAAGSPSGSGAGLLAAIAAIAVFRRRR
jgi:uncharacterized protein (TIGR03382 family)